MVVNRERIVLGLMRGEMPGPDEALVCEVMEGGPSTYRPHVPATEMAERLTEPPQGHIVVIGATGVFDPVVDGVALQFGALGDGSFVDMGSNSRCDILGRAVDGHHAGRRLSAVDHVDTFWFAWAAYLRGTSIVPDRAAP